MLWGADWLDPCYGNCWIYSSFYLGNKTYKRVIENFARCSQMDEPIVDEVIKDNKNDGTKFRN
ncbi:MAG: hypothetical protein R2837_03630 [Aliarcobacter sp.]